MVFEPKNYDHLLGKLKINDDQLKAHFTLYQGYVKKLNEINDLLGKADRSAPNYSYNLYSELKRREPVAYNGTLLHELYFDNLAPQGTSPSGRTREALQGSFGSFDAYIADTKAAASSAHGWVLTVYDPVEKKLKTNLVHSEHHVGLLANATIVMALDLWEHAYAIQFGIKKPDYIQAFLDNLNWDAVNRRLEGALKNSLVAVGS